MLVTEETFYEIIEDTWTSTLGFQVDRAALLDFSPVGAFTVCVKITGAWDGEVRLHCSPQLARSVAAVIFHVEPENVGTYEILDALSELTHIVGGNLKALLPQPVSLSLPCLLDPNNWVQTTPQWQMVCRLSLMSKGHPFVVTLFGDLPAGARAETSADEKRQLPTQIT